MSLTRLLILIAISFGAGFLTRWRNWVLLVLSIVVLFWLQPGTPIRNLSFWFPLASLALAGAVWVITTTEDRRRITDRQLWSTVLVIAGTVVLMGLSRYIELPFDLLAARPPDLLVVVIALIMVVALGLVLARTQSVFRVPSSGISLLLAVMIALFILLKFEPSAQAISMGLRALNGQDVAQANALDLRWLGFSYIVFRLIHVLREKQNGKLVAMSLQEFVIYVIFFPAVSAGPIDRSERFVKDLRAPYRPNADVAYDAGRRLVIGIFKKYALADTLALIALNEINAGQIRAGATGWAWLIVYAYALRIYFDFSGYTDIATGLGRWFGIKLPENFNAPYLKPNLTQFWNSWHMSLSQWFRAYWFNPLTRALRQRKWEQSQIIFVGQVSTMLLIALWHGITPNFVAWGVWHALGLFVHNRWAEFAKVRQIDLSRFSFWPNVIGTLLTFHYVALGWVWFALPTLGLSWQTFIRLIGR